MARIARKLLVGEERIGVVGGGEVRVEAFELDMLADCRMARTMAIASSGGAP